MIYILCGIVSEEYYIYFSPFFQHFAFFKYYVYIKNIIFH